MEPLVAGNAGVFVHALAMLQLALALLVQTKLGVMFKLEYVRKMFVP